MSEHARLSASQSERWMICPGSVALTAQLPKQPSSHAANEGTAAHELAAMCLNQGMQPIEMVGRIITVEDKELKLKEDFEVDEEMAEAVTIYTDYIAKLLIQKSDAKFYVEKKFDLTWLRPNMFGTNDASIFEPGIELIVADLKYGRGVIVEPMNNSQLSYYGVGALRTALPIAKGQTIEDWFTQPDMPKSVRLVIVQPRARHKQGPIREWVISTEELWAWRIKLAFAADETLKDDAKILSGEHCRWCPATGICPALRGAVEEQAQMDFTQLPAVTDKTYQMPDLISPQDLSQALNALPVVEMWCRGVASAAQSYLENGGDIPGFKLVRKKSNRKWNDEEGLLKQLLTSELDEKHFLSQPKLLGPAQLEKVKQLGKVWVAERCHKPEGGLTVTNDIDPRPAVNGPNVQLFEQAPLDIEIDVTEEDIFA